MKNFDTRTYSINDFLEWYDNNQLELAPKFQRRSVWTDTARSYLMDTILEGKPIPKVFIRQKLNPQTKKSVREVVDGQQRLRTIISYLRDGFTINKRHNKEFGGFYFSQLGEVNEDIQSQVLNYEISVDLLVNMSDSDVLDVFSRLNSYSVTLNEQEKINANHFSAFKTLSDRIAHEHNTFWTSNKILSEQNVLRMLDVQLTADLLIGMLEGIKSKKQIKKQYEIYERKFDHDVDELDDRFNNIICIISEIFNHDLSKREFRRVHVFYSLFLSIYHLKYGILNNIKEKWDFQKEDYPRISQKLERIDYIFYIEDKDLLNKEEKQFLDNCRRATTDAPVRVKRSDFLIDLILQD